MCNFRHGDRRPDHGSLIPACSLQSMRFLNETAFYLSSYLRVCPRRAEHQPPDQGCTDVVGRDARSGSSCERPHGVTHRLKCTLRSSEHSPRTGHQSECGSRRHWVRDVSGWERRRSGRRFVSVLMAGTLSSRSSGASCPRALSSPGLWEE